MKLEIVFKDGRKESFEGVESYKVIANEKCYVSNIPQAPIEGKRFEVNPLGIDRRIFEKRRNDQWQEWTRQIIQDAFAEVDKQPEKYASAFYTLIPEMKWNSYSYKTVAKLKEYANELGGLMADWVEQALEWAQRIFNGETWEAICNNADTANWYRVILWKNGYYRIVGGSRLSVLRGNSNTAASAISSYEGSSSSRVISAVPMVVFKKK